MTVYTGDGEVARLHNQLARALSGDPSVRLAWLHGSRARGTARRKSDIDVAVLLDEEHTASPSAVKDFRSGIWPVRSAAGFRAIGSISFSSTMLLRYCATA